MIFIKEHPPETGQTATMLRVLHSLSCALLALALVLAGPGVPRAAEGATMLVICAGESTSTVWLDRDGNPVDPAAQRHNCPDCLTFDLPPSPTMTPAVSRVPSGLAARTSLPGDLRAEPIAHLRPDPRGPPALSASCRRDGDPRHDTWFLPCATRDPLDQHQAGNEVRVGGIRVMI